MRKFALGAFVVAVVAFTACNRVPDEVIQPEAMAQLMADMRVADAVVSVNSREYPTRASKDALREAVLERHNVTTEQFDSSLVWYGHHIEKYQEVTDRSIEILQLRQAEVGAMASAAMSVAGDSVEVWDAARYFNMSSRTPSRFLTFHYKSDRNWQPGDIYTWRVKFIVPPSSAQWAITTTYDDGSTEVASASLYVAAPGRQEISFFTDSTRVARTISGWLRVESDGIKPIIVDSVSLTRRRLDQNVGLHRGLQRLFKPRQDDPVEE